jgi:hypothetical protein
MLLMLLITFHVHWCANMCWSTQEYYDTVKMRVARRADAFFILAASDGVS